MTVLTGITALSRISSEVIGEKKELDLCIAIGPLPMMRAVSNLTREYGLKTVVLIPSWSMGQVCAAAAGSLWAAKQSLPVLTVGV